MILNSSLHKGILIDPKERVNYAIPQNKRQMQTIMSQYKKYTLKVIVIKPPL